MFTPLPKSIVQSEKVNANYSLLFNKWINFDGNFDDPRELKENKIAELIRLKDEYGKRGSQLKASATAQKIRAGNLLCQLQRKGLSVALLVCKVSDALVCGIGDEHPLENSLRFDHCTGLPYIPSSSIKGVAKFAAKSNETKDERTRNKEGDIFGTQDQVGKVQFWDGFPVEVPTLKIDIMNNHFPDYYSGKSSAPSDDMNPNPVPFIVVDSDSEFYFPIVARDQDTLQRAIDFLEKALGEWGVGAKTSVGYGMFYDFEKETIVPPPPKPKPISARDVALDNLKRTVNADNFAKLLVELKEEDEEWLKAQDLFLLGGFNVGFADTLFHQEMLPANLKKILAQEFLNRIDPKKAKKWAAKGNKKDLDRLEKLTKIIDEQI